MRGEDRLSGSLFSYVDLEARVPARHPLRPCPSSKHLGRLSLFQNGGSGSSWFDVKPLGVDGSSGGTVRAKF